MSRQSSLDTYFKSSKVSVSPLACYPKTLMDIDNEKTIRKRTLSLKKPVTPIKSPKIEDPHRNEVIDLCSDDENLVVVKQEHDNIENELQHYESKNITPSPSLFESQRNVNGDNEYLTPPGTSNSANYVTPTTSKSNVSSTPIKTENADMIKLVSVVMSDYTTPSVSTHSSRTSQITTIVKDEGGDSDASQDTVVYSPPTTPQKRTPQTPDRKSCTPFTPKSTQTSQTPSSTFKSPSSGKKYFSPVKKRAVPIKMGVRRSLAQNMEDLDKNELFKKACDGLDDKTIFLLTIINKCINDSSLYHLLDGKSQSLLSTSMHVVKPGMRLVCRLYWHKQGWYRIDKIKSILSGGSEKLDDPTMHLVLESLLQKEFIQLGGSEGNAISFDEFTSILNLDDLKQICKDLKLKMNSKQCAIAALKKYSMDKPIYNYFNANNSNNGSRVLKIMSDKAGPCYRLSESTRKTIYELNMLMYLGINYEVLRDNTLELTLLYDKIKRETYPVEEDMLDNASVVFKQRDEFQRYLRAHETYEEYLAEKELDRKLEIILMTFDDFKNLPDGEKSRCEDLPMWLRRYTPMYIFVKILEAGIQELKKASKYDLALEVLQELISQSICRQHKKADWYAEKSLILHKSGQLKEAAMVLLEGFELNIHDYAKDSMRPRAKLIAKKKGLNLDDDIRARLLEYASKEDILESNIRGVHIYKPPMDRSQQRGKLKYETRISGERLVQDVEEYCLSDYLSSGEFTDGIHCEGRLVTTIFFLLFWEVIYWKPAGCPGVFLSRFQRYPLDMFCETFQRCRREEVEARLALLRRCGPDDLAAILSDKWNQRPNCEQSGLWREGLRLEQVCEVCRCLGPDAVAALCSRLASDFRYTHSGFPDLTLWNTRTNQIRFVEVKSDTDRPSMKQIQWMHYLQKHGIDTEFCYVGVNTTKSKARSVS